MLVNSLFFPFLALPVSELCWNMCDFEIRVWVPPPLPPLKTSRELTAPGMCLPQSAQGQVYGRPLTSICQIN